MVISEEDLRFRSSFPFPLQRKAVPGSNPVVVSTFQLMRVTHWLAGSKGEKEPSGKQFCREFSPWDGGTGLHCDPVWEGGASLEINFHFFFFPLLSFFISSFFVRL